MARPSAGAHGDSELAHLFHRLNNQLGVVLANAELLESRLANGPHQARAAEVVTGALEALDTSQKIRALVGTPEDESTPGQQSKP